MPLFQGVEKPELNVKKDMDTSLHSIFTFFLINISKGLPKYRTYEIRCNVAVNCQNAAISCETAPADALFVLYARLYTTAMIS